MSLVAVYRALKQSGADENIANEAVEAIERQTGRDKSEWQELRQWRSATDQRLTRLETQSWIIITMLGALIVAAVGSVFFG